MRRHLTMAMFVTWAVLALTPSATAESANPVATAGDAGPAADTGGGQAPATKEMKGKWGRQGPKGMGRHGGGFQGGPGNPRWLLRQLDLSETQWDKIRATHAAWQPKIETFQATLNKAHEELQTLLFQQSDQAKAKHEEISRLQAQVGEAHFEVMRAVIEVLTPEQRSRAEALARQRHQGKAGRWPKGEGKGRGSRWFGSPFDKGGPGNGGSAPAEDNPAGDHDQGPRDLH